MTVALRPLTTKTLLIAFGVLLGLLAIALLVTTQLAGSHAHLVDAATTHVTTKYRALGILWH